jgi:sensor histidine kinase YesM
LAIGLPAASLLTGAMRARAEGPTLSATPLGAAVFMLLMMVVFYGYFTIRGLPQRAERQALEAQLKLLQGQIEPHFLFNTLANVVGLMESDTPRAKLMLESFVDYLRSSLGGMRKADHTLGDELGLVEAYLRVIQIRMEDRLHYTIDVRDDLRKLELPALTLQPLVENAVLHGLEPKIDGGSVRIAARLDELRGTRTLVLTIDDDGLGLAQDRPARRSGSGTALANIRERLAQSYGDAAGLRVEPATPGGVRATLTLPAHALAPITDPIERTAA